MQYQIRLNILDEIDDPYSFEDYKKCLSWEKYKLFHLFIIYHIDIRIDGTKKNKIIFIIIIAKIKGEKITTRRLLRWTEPTKADHSSSFQCLSSGFYSFAP